MKVYGVVISPFVRKVLAVCSIKGLEIEEEAVIPGSAPAEYLEISPLGKIPALQDGNLKISDSTVICEYLEDKYPNIAVMPSSPEDRAHARWLEEYGDSKLMESFAPFFFEHMVKKIMGMGEPDEAKLEQLAAEAIPECLEYVESIVPEADFFFGAIGTADIAIVSPFITGGYGGCKWDESAYPKTAAFIARVKAHPAIVSVLEAELAAMAAFTG